MFVGGVFFLEFIHRRSDVTKCVRIENADTSSYKVVVQVWDKNPDPSGPDILAKEIRLDHPTAMTDSSVYLTSTRYLVVKEVVE